MKIDLLNIPVYYINLDSKEEKRKSTESLLKRLGFKEVYRVSAISHSKGRIVGCARSHYEILKTQKPPFIILEDDCSLSKEFNSILEIPNDADAFYLGISHWGRYLNHSGPYVHYKKVNDDIVRVYNMLATHAILYLTDSYAEVCKRISYHYGYEVEEHLDIGFAEIHKLYNVYSYDVPLFSQYDWNVVTSGKLSEVSINEEQSKVLFDKINNEDENFYKFNSQFKTPFKELSNRVDRNNIPGYFLPTKIL